MAETGKITLGDNPTVKPQNPTIPAQFTDSEFIDVTEDIELPSLGVFYPNNKKTVKIKYLTTEEEDVLFSPELLRSGKVLDALLQIAVIDKELRPDDIIVGDRNYILIHLRKTGIGNIYKPGMVTCPSCNEEYEPEIDLEQLKVKKLEQMPDQDGHYEFLLPTMKRTIKFRLLNGKDENRISKSLKGGLKKAGSYKVSSSVTDRYRLQIVEVDGNKDPIYISRFISAMPMKDSVVFKEYVKIISPGVDFNYMFTCKSCGHSYEEDVPLNYRLFYPNAEL